MDLMEARRRMLMGQKIPERWDHVFVKEYVTQSWFLDVTEGQTITVQWETPTGVTQNLNGWVLNGNGCCESIRQVRQVGENGERTLPITQSGQVRVGAYSNSSTYGLTVSSIIRIRFE